MQAADNGKSELKNALKNARHAILAIGVFSFFVNLLVLTGPLFMLQVYDRVIPARSAPTLAALTLIMALLFFFQGYLDHLRARIGARVATNFVEALSPRVFSLFLKRPKLLKRGQTDFSALSASYQDLEAIYRLFSARAAFAVFDLPWAPLFICFVYVLHPLLGLTALAGGLVLVLISIANQWATFGTQDEVATARRKAEELATLLRRDSEAVRALGLMENAQARWFKLRRQMLDTSLQADDRGGGFATATKTFRFFLQSLVLAVGAYLVLEKELTAGAMIAASIMTSRGLAPVDMAIANWGLFQRGFAGWKRLDGLLQSTPEEDEKISLPKPEARLAVRNASVLATGSMTPLLRNIAFELKGGQALGVIGASGAGKTALARALTGVSELATGEIRLGDGAIDQYRESELYQHIGYLPQDVALFEGTIAENIARLSLEVDEKAVVEAAQKAGAHGPILRLEKGYETPLEAGAHRLSGGQRQRVGLARALYGDPVMVILDEPDANLDGEGAEALKASIRKLKNEGKIVIMMAHRPSVLNDCDLLLLLDQGRQIAVGPRQDVLRQLSGGPNTPTSGGAS